MLKAQVIGKRTARTACTISENEDTCYPLSLRQFQCSWLVFCRV